MTARSEPADDDEHHHHGAGDEAEHADGAVTAEEEGDDEAGEDRAEPAPRINEAHGLGADAGRIKLGLIGVERKRQPIGAQRDQETAHDHADCGGLLREQKAERGDADGGPGDLPFALEAVGEVDADQRADRRRHRDNESVGERLGDADALRDQERRHPAGEPVIADRLEQIEDHQHDGAAAIGRVPHLRSRRRACSRLRRRRFAAAAARAPVSARMRRSMSVDDALRLRRCGRAAPASAAIPAGCGGSTRSRPRRSSR